MSRRMYLTGAEIKSMLETIEQKLKSACCPPSQITIDTTPEQTGEIAWLTFSPSAYAKMLALVMDYETEVQWHGIIRRTDAPCEFYVEDILIFPHTTSSATVISDQEQYEEWLDKLDDDTFNHLRFHGHSHVNMSVFPSETDKDYRKNLVSKISAQDDNPYYIFLIINKKHQITAQIFDIQNNIIYDSNDIIVDVDLGDNGELSDFLKDAHLVAKAAVVPATENQLTKSEKKKIKKYGGYWGTDNKWHSYEYDD